MENLYKLQQFISNIGWFSKKITLTITLENEFEGFYGYASESWEQRVTITIDSPDPDICPSLKVIGRRFESIEDVARRVMLDINKCMPLTFHKIN